MTQYISKNAIVAEIETYTSNYKEILNKVGKSSDNLVYTTLMLDSKIDVLQHILSFLNTLEVKEVDIETSARYYLLSEHKSPLNEVFHQADLKSEMQYHEDIEKAFKAGFKLGLKAQKGE